MTGYIGCIGLLGIALFIGLLFLRRKKIEGGMSDFYKENSLYTTENAPPNIRESLGASDNLYACQANLTTTAGANVEFYWWEWYIKSTTMINNAPSTSSNYYLAVSFAPGTVSDEFIQKAIRWADKSDDDAAQKVKDFFVVNTETPYRAEKLADGSFLICWQVLKRRDIYDAKINWLKQNVAIKITPEIALLDEIHARISAEPIAAAPPVIEAVPVTKQPVGVVFYRHDDYPTLRHKFSSAWPNLQLELHHNSSKFDKEGYDEFESNTTFAAPNTPNEALFSLTGDMIPAEAENRFEKNFGGRALILRDGISVERRESLDYCNNPFRLPINVYTYAEFKQRFTERWTNLSIKIYDTAPHNGGLWQNDKELADDFDMKNLKNAGQAFLHDYVFISDWGTLLKNVQVAAAIKNNRLGIYAERDLRNKRLKEFQALEKI